MSWLLISASVLLYLASLIIWLRALPGFYLMFRYVNQPKHREVMILFPTCAAMLESSYSAEGLPLFKQFKKRFCIAALLLLTSGALRLANDYFT